MLIACPARFRRIPQNRSTPILAESSKKVLQNSGEPPSALPGSCDRQRTGSAECVSAGARVHADAGSTIQVAPDMAEARLFDPATEQALV